MAGIQTICIIGFGGMGKLYWRELTRLDGVRVTSVVSHSLPPEAAAAMGIEVYRSLREMLETSPASICCVCTPSYMHFEQIEALLQAGVSVIAEKPLCLRAEQAARLFALAKEKNVRLFAAQVVRFSYPAELLRAWVLSGSFGRVLDASFSRLSTKPFWGGDGWVFDQSKSGLIPYDLHLHDLDLMVSLFGEPERAQYLDCGSGTKAYAEHCRFSYAYPGFHVFAEAAWFDAAIPFTMRWRVSFERALVCCDGEQVTLYRPGLEPERFAPPASDRMNTGINVPASDMYAKELAHLIACILDGQPSRIICDEEVVCVLRILNRMIS